MNTTEKKTRKDIYFSLRFQVLELIVTIFTIYFLLPSIQKSKKKESPSIVFLGLSTIKNIRIHTQDNIHTRTQGAMGAPGPCGGVQHGH